MERIVGIKYFAKYVGKLSFAQKIGNGSHSTHAAIRETEVNGIHKNINLKLSDVYNIRDDYFNCN